MREEHYPDNFREEETAYLIQRVKSTESALVSGIPGVGKSGFLRYLINNPALRVRYPKELENVIFVYLDVNDLTELSMAEFYRNFLQQLKLAAAFLPIEPELTSWPNTGDSFILLQTIKNFLALILSDQKRKIVVVIDRFEQLLNTFDETFFNNLRALRDDHKTQYLYLAAYNRQSEKSANGAAADQLLPLFASFHLNVKPLGFTDTERVIAGLLKETPFTLAEFQKEEIYGFCGGHPGLIKIYLQSLKSRGAAVSWESFIREINENHSIKQTLGEIYQYLSEAELAVLLKVAKNEKLNGSSDQSLSSLTDLGVLNKNSGSYSLFSRAFENYLKNYSPRQSRLSIDANSKRVFLNQTEITRSITNQEYKLLAFLMDHSEKVVSRDEIAAAVWAGDNIKGVSDEAIDQLISRLRAKIETDKNNPQCLLTLRGRGFIFNRQ